MTNSIPHGSSSERLGDESKEEWSAERRTTGDTRTQGQSHPRPASRTRELFPNREKKIKTRAVTWTARKRWRRIDAPHPRAGHPDATSPADGPGRGARDRGKSPRMPAAMASLDAAGMHSGQGEVLARAVRASMMKAQTTTRVSRMLRTCVRTMFMAVSSDRKSTRLNSSH